MKPTAEPGHVQQYNLKTGREYVLELNAYGAAAGSDFAEVLESKSSGPLLAVSDPVIKTLGQATESLVFLRTGLVSTAETGVLVLRGTEKHRSNAPRVELLLRVKPPPSVFVLALAILLGAATVAAGISARDWADGTRDMWITKITGGIIVAAIGYFAAKRVPGLRGK